jgi:thioesterase domain-containing protein
LNIARTLALSAEDRCLSVNPLFHIHGIMVTLATLLSGGSVACVPPHDAARFFAWLEELRPTWYSAVPAVHQAILAGAAQAPDASARPRLRFVRSSSASMPARVLAELERVFEAPVIESYGMTEGAHQIASNPLPPGQRKVGSVGLPAGPEVTILDETGRELAAGQVGEVAIRGASVMRGYDNAPEANASAFVGGWLRTGDQGYLDEDGYLFLTGRLKELINRGGEKISPREVDEALMDHPSVARAVAFPLPHAVLGEEVAAAVVPREGETVSEREIREFAATRLADFKVPRRVAVVPAIPTGPTGKYQRRLLAEQLGLLRPAQRRTADGERRGGQALDALEAQLVQIWERLFGMHPISVTDDFFDLGGHSLLGARMLAEVEEVCGWTLPPSTLFNAPTIEQLASILLAQQRTSDTGPSLVTIRAGDGRVPFVLLHGDFNGGGFYCRNIAKRLDPRQPFHVFPPHGSNGDPVPPTVEAMAEDFLARLHVALPDGPLLLGGFSQAGLVAFEMAQRLAAQGRRVAGLVVIDKAVEDPRWRILETVVEQIGRVRGHPVGRRRDTFLRWQYYARRAWKLARSDLRAQARYLLAKAGLGRTGPSVPSVRAVAAEEQVLGRRQRHLMEAYEPVIDAYVPRRYRGHLTLIASLEGPASLTDDPTLGWSRVARELRVASVPGDHLTCVTTHVGILAERLDTWLQEMQT